MDAIPFPSLSLDAFAAPPALASQLVLMACIVASLLVLEQISLLIVGVYARQASITELTSSLDARKIISRRQLEGVAMLFLGLEGVRIQSGYGWGFEGVQGRTFEYCAGTYRLVTFQLAYQFWNTITSLRDGDGAIFVGHHLVTSTLCYLLLTPFSLAFAPYFMGVSEVSTSPLCFLAMFDEQFGVPALGKRFPTTKVFLGVVFASLFVACRVFGWLYYSAAFWGDMLSYFPDFVHKNLPHDLAASIVHVEHPEAGMAIGPVSPPGFTFFGIDGDFHPTIVFILICNIGMTVLQFVWLGEIIMTAAKEFGPKKKQA